MNESGDLGFKLVWSWIQNGTRASYRHMTIKFIGNQKGVLSKKMLAYKLYNRTDGQEKSTL